LPRDTNMAETSSACRSELSVTMRILFAMALLAFIKKPCPTSKALRSITGLAPNAAVVGANGAGAGIGAGAAGSRYAFTHLPFGSWLGSLLFFCQLECEQFGVLLIFHLTIFLK